MTCCGDRGSGCTRSGSCAAFLEDEFGAVLNFGVGNTVNPMDGWNSGYKFGNDLASSVGELSMGLSDIESMLLHTCGSSQSGIEPAFSASSGRFLSIVPPGKS